MQEAKHSVFDIVGVVAGYTSIEKAVVWWKVDKVCNRFSNAATVQLCIIVARTLGKVSILKIIVFHMIY